MLEEHYEPRPGAPDFIPYDVTVGVAVIGGLGFIRCDVTVGVAVIGGLGCRQVLEEHYEQGALMLSEEAIHVLGLLVGLNVIDCNLCMKVSQRFRTREGWG